MIDDFSNEFLFLSNFYNANVTYDGITYRSSEAAYQAAKAKDRGERYRFSSMTPRTSKNEGRKLEMREDWEFVKVDIMTDILHCKFTQHNDLKERLLMTEDQELVEGNTWNDTFWGVCRGEGANHLGLCLMELRNKLKNSN